MSASQHLKMKKILLIIVFSILGIFSNATMALTEKDCRDRVNNAMYNSDKLGGNDTDAYRWAQNAANECFKEIASQRSSSVADSKPRGGFDWGFVGVAIMLAMVYAAPALIFGYSPKFAKIIFYILATACTAFIIKFTISEFEEDNNWSFYLILVSCLLVDFAGYKFYKLMFKESK